MLDKVHRLKKNRQFSYIYKNGQIKHSKILSLVYVKTKYQPFKVGFTVSKKIGKSVVRSKVKRRLREAFREHMSSVNPNYNYVFIAREGIQNANYQEISKIISQLILKAGLKNRNEE